MRAIEHRVWEALRCQAVLQLKAHRLATFGGLGDAMDARLPHSAPVGL